MERAMNKVSFTIIARSARIDPTEGGQLFVDIRDTNLEALLSNVGISECLNAIGVERCKKHFGVVPVPPKKKALDVTLERKGREVRATVNYVDPKLVERAKRSSYVLVKGNGYQVCLGTMLSIFPNLRALAVGPDGDRCAKTFDTEAAAAEYVERITKLLDIINANEPQEGGEVCVK
jgi:hypothetical protein